MRCNRVFSRGKDGVGESLSFRRSENDTVKAVLRRTCIYGSAEKTRGSLGGRRKKKKKKCRIQTALSAIKSVQKSYHFNTCSFSARVSRIFVRTCGGKREKKKKNSKESRVHEACSSVLECPELDLGSLEPKHERLENFGSQVSKRLAPSKISKTSSSQPRSLCGSLRVCTHASRTHPYASILRE